MTYAIVQGRIRFIKFTAGLAALIGATACGAAPVSSTGEEEVSTRADELPASAWANGWNVVTTPSAQLQVGGSPVACETRFGSNGGTALLERDAQNHFNVSTAFRSGFSDWTSLGSRVFTTRAACTSLDAPYAPGLDSNQFAVVGRSGASNTYRIAIWALGTISIDGTPPTPPTMVHDWDLVSSADAFSSAPAATVYFGRLIVAGRKANNRIYLRTRSLFSGSDPFGPGTWDPTVTVPALPTGWTAAGDPSIVSAPSGLEYLPTLATRATNGGSTGYFRITTEGSLFSAWTRFTLPTGVTPASDLSMELGADRTQITAYFRATTGRIYQSSATIGASTFPAFRLMFTNSDTFTDGPAAIGGALFVDPHHMVFAKKTNQGNLLWFAQTSGVN